MIPNIYAEMNTLVLHGMATRAYRRLCSKGLTPRSYWNLRAEERAQVLYNAVVAELERRGQAFYWWEKR
jgi:hypothetical protein